MDDELAVALELTSGGRMVFSQEDRTLGYASPEGTRLRLVTDAHDLRSLLQLMLLVERPEPTTQPSLDVACGLLLTLLDARPDLASRSLAHVRAAVARAIPWSVDAREVAQRQSDGTRPAARTRPRPPIPASTPALPTRREQAS